MKRYFMCLTALALAAVLLVPETSFAQGRGGRGGSWGGSRGGSWGGSRSSWGVSVGPFSYGTGYYGRYGGYGYGGYGYGYGSRPYYGYSSGYYSSPSYYDSGSYVYTEPSTVYTTPSYSTSYADTASYSSTDNSGTIVVRVPANAELFWNGTRSTMTGPERRFGTLPLGAEGATQEFTARWMGPNGQMVSQSRQVRGMPNQVAVVDFTQPQTPAPPQPQGGQVQFQQQPVQQPVQPQVVAPQVQPQVQPTTVQPQVQPQVSPQVQPQVVAPQVQPQQVQPQQPPQ